MAFKNRKERKLREKAAFEKRDGLALDLLARSWKAACETQWSEHGCDCHACKAMKTSGRERTAKVRFAWIISCEIVYTELFGERPNGQLHVSKLDQLGSGHFSDELEKDPRFEEKIRSHLRRYEENETAFDIDPAVKEKTDSVTLDVLARTWKQNCETQWSQQNCDCNVCAEMLRSSTERRDDINDMWTNICEGLSKSTDPMVKLTIPLAAGTFADSVNANPKCGEIIRSHLMKYPDYEVTWEET